MGVYTAELFNNLGLCCFYAQQYDMTLQSFERALSLSEDDLITADIWYNVGQVAMVRSGGRGGGGGKVVESIKFNPNDGNYYNLV